MLRPITLIPASAQPQRPVLGETPFIHPSAEIYDCQIGSWTEIGPRTVMSDSIFDDYSYVAGDAIIAYTEIGKFCSLASHVRVNPVNHPLDRVTQHHCTYRRIQYGFDSNDDDAIFRWRRDSRCTIGHDVWLGHGAIIMPGVTVGIGAAVGSGAVVTHDVEPYTIVVGVPARPIRRRFDEQTIARLLESAWWDWDHATLKERFSTLLDVQAFLMSYAVPGAARLPCASEG